jgi:hypothetical protein
MADLRNRTTFERRVQGSALAAGPLLLVLGVLAMLMDPEAFAESDSASGAGLWLGAAFGLAMFVAFTAVPQLLFGLALRSGTRVALTSTAIFAPLWALYFGLLPLAAALIGGWSGLAPLAVLASAAAGALDVFVFVAAMRGRRRLRRRGSDGAPSGAGSDRSSENY